MTALRLNFDWAATRKRVHLVLEGGGATDRFAAMVHRLLVVTSLVSVFCAVLASVPEIAARHAGLFIGVEAFTISIFLAEHGLRIWGACENIAFHGSAPMMARLRYCATFPAVIDLMAILPPFLSAAHLGDERQIVLLQLSRFFKIIRYSPGMRSLLAAIKSEQRALLAFGIILMGLVLVTAGTIYVAEPEKFRTVPEAMYWAVVTLTTTGYGDLVPETVSGRIVASVTMIIGVMMVALPVGIVATAFANELHKRDFVVNWAMLANVPLFKGLQAKDIADILACLRSKNIVAGGMIVRKGDDAHSMFFITSGEVCVELSGGSVYLGNGQFFGEMAILRQTKRSADVRATVATKLLVLDASDFNALIDRNPEIGRNVREVAAKRADAAPKTP